MTAPPPWRLPDPPKRRRSWLLDDRLDTLPAPAEAASAPARRVSRDAGGSWPVARGAEDPLRDDEIRDADSIDDRRRNLGDVYVEAVQPFRVKYAGVIEDIPAGQRLLYQHPIVRVMPRRYFKPSAVRRPDVGKSSVTSGTKVRLVVGTVR